MTSKLNNFLTRRRMEKIKIARRERDIIDLLLNSSFRSKELISCKEQGPRQVRALESIVRMCASGGNQWACRFSDRKATVVGG